MKYRVEPRDAPPEYAARLLGLTLAQFNEKLPRLIDRNFPPADIDTGNYDLEAIRAWQDRRHPRLFGLPAPRALDASTVVQERLRARGVS
jgi:hypothetical protein